MFSIVRSVKSFTRADWIEALRHRGRPVRTLASAWVDALVHYGKTITLCGACQHKFDEGRAKSENAPTGYEKLRMFGASPFVQSQCDGCRSDHEACAVYLPRRRTVHLDERGSGRWR